MHDEELLIDLHMHSTNSDGTCTTRELLEILRQDNAKIISFTDHDSVDCYRDIALNKASIYPGLIVIPGVELSCRFEGNLRDILGYGIDVHTIRQYLNEKYSYEKRLRKQQQLLHQFQDVCRAQNLIFSDSVHVSTGHKAEAFVAMYHELNKYPENIQRFPFIADNNSFFWDYYSNRESPFFVDETFDFPSFEDSVRIIHEAGGFAFLAHPFAYRMSVEETFRMADAALAAGIDGVELKHSSNQGDDVSHILSYIKAHRLLTSGGSDFHGSLKPDLKLIYGYHNMRVHFSEISAWYSRVIKFCDQSKEIYDLWA